MSLRTHLRRLAVSHKATALAESVARHHLVGGGDTAEGPSGHTYRVMTAEYIAVADGGIGWVDTLPVETKILVVDGTTFLGIQRGPLFDPGTHERLELEPASFDQRQMWLGEAADVVEGIATQVRSRRPAAAPRSGTSAPRLDVSARHLGRQVDRILSF